MTGATSVASLTPVTHLLYLHGFRSSPQSTKARKFAAWVAANRPELVWWCPQLPASPTAAMREVMAGVAGWRADRMAVIGSSLGGFYATVMAERLGCRAALLNPAVHPHRHFERYLGPQKNLYTGEAFELTRAHIDDLAAIDPPAITRPDRYWLFVETADEVLDYREAVAFYRGALQEVVRGGDHALVSFPEHIPEIVAWALSCAQPRKGAA
jgi:predicted esterase YcpF (UPF0227 family)